MEFIFFSNGINSLSKYIILQSLNVKLESTIVAITPTYKSFWRVLSKPSMLFIKLPALIWSGTDLRMRLVIMAYIH